MIQLYTADSSSFIGKIALKQLLKELPVSMHKKALRFRFDRDKYNYVLGRLLLKRGLKYFGLEQQIDQIVFNKNGKPLLENIFFNISHSDHFVICGFSPTGEIGVDIEKLKPIALKDFTNWLTKKEWRDIYAAKNPTHRFYWYWTRKESIIKALGINLSYLHQIEIDASRDSFVESGKEWFLSDLNLGAAYCAAVCSEKEIGKVRIAHFNFIK